MFQKYEASSLIKIYHPALIEQCKANTEKACYEYKPHKGVCLNDLNIELDRITNGDYWTKRILEEIMWFYFQGILEHASYYSKRKKRLLHSLLKVFHMLLIIICNDDRFNADKIGIEYNNCNRTMTYHLKN